MGSILHPNAKTTPKIREEIQNSEESYAKLANKYHLNIKTVQKWKKAQSVQDGKSGPRTIKSSLSTEQQQLVCEFRRITKFALDDVYICLKPHIPTLSRSNLHRCLKRNGLNRLPVEDGQDKKKKKKFKDYEIGYVHVDITEMNIDKNKHYLFAAIDRVCKYGYVELHDNKTMKTSREFLQNLIEDIPFKIHTILTDNGSQFTYELLAEHLRPKNKIHDFDKICLDNNIEHRLTRFRHPWTNGQVEVFCRVLKDHTTKAYHYDSIEQLKHHIMSFLLLYNYQKKLKSLNYKTPYDIIVDNYNIKPYLFKDIPTNKFVGLNKYCY
jgi:transposase-like protein